MSNDTLTAVCRALCAHGMDVARRPDSMREQVAISECIDVVEKMMSEGPQAGHRARRQAVLNKLFMESVEIARELGAADVGPDGTAHSGIRARLAQVFMAAMVEVE
jgi:hypothetical protein